MSTVILFIVLCCAAIQIPKIYLYFVRHGCGIAVFNHYPGPCRVIPNIECGAEDVAVTRDGLAFISNGNPASNPCPPSLLRGNIYLFDFNEPDKNVTRLSIISDYLNSSDFEPHGLSIWEGSKAETLLFAVDHGGKREKVQIFSFDRKKRNVLLHTETIYDDLFRCLNDLVTIGPRQFYITNYVYYCHSKHSDLTATLEHMFYLPWGNVVYYDGTKGKIAAKNLVVPNGINTSPDRKYLFVASSVLQEVLMYKIKPNKELQQHNVFKVYTDIDNIEVDQDSGDLYMGAHRREDRFLLMDYNGSLPSPSQVIRVKPIDKEWHNVEVTEVLSSDGLNFVRASSVGSFYKGQLLVGGVYHRLGYCKVLNTKTEG